MRLRILLTVACFISLLASRSAVADPPILFATQAPWAPDFGTINAVFGNHLASMDVAPRGGDLYLRTESGELRNLTKAAGFGNEGFQGANSIAVRDPAVHWDGTKAIFSMVIGAPSRQYEVNQYRWQLYEVTGFGANDTPVITKVPNQPAEYNNVMAVYGSDDSIIFVSDRPRDGQAHLYPQLDEYESTATNTGLWKLSPDGALVLLDHAPSGDFHPIIDSFGRVIFSRWDHLQRDQQKDAGGYGTFDYSSEASDSIPTSNEVEVFPEARSDNDPDKKPHEELHTINQFFPWMVNQDGTDLETLNHVGRQELGEYGSQSRNDDPNLTYISSGGIRTASDMFLHMREDPLAPGTFYAINAPEFGTHASGQVISINGAPSVNPADMRVTYITHPDTSGTSDSPPGTHSGLYRNPYRLSNGDLLASHTANTRQDSNIGTSAAPRSRYDFRIVKLTKNGEFYTAGARLTSGIKKTISFWQPDYRVSFDDVEMWELYPVEVKATPRPPMPSLVIPAVEQKMLDELQISIADLKQFLIERDLALVVARNVTTRDAADQQQPFNLRIAGTETKTVGASGTVYDIAALQFFQGDLIRGIGGSSSPRAGRRPLSRPMHDLPVENVSAEGLPPGSVALGSDGSVAAFVPARRALSWQLVSPGGEGIVRERYWLTFQPGEVRVCASCHGVNKFDQAGAEAPVNPPEALRTLLSSLSTAPTDPAPTFSVEIQSKKKGKKAARLTRGDKFSIRVTGTNAAAGSKAISVIAAIGSCSETYDGTTNADGSLTINGVIPKAGKKSKLNVALSRLGIQAASTSAAVAAKKGAAKKERACKALFKK